MKDKVAPFLLLAGLFAADVSSAPPEPVFVCVEGEKGSRLILVQNRTVRERKGISKIYAVSRERLLVREGRDLVCLDARTWNERWRVVNVSVHSVGVVSDRVVLWRNDKT